MKRISLHQRGAYTLVEMMIAAMIISIAFGASYTIMAAGQATWLTTDTNIQLQENLRNAMDKMTMELRQTKAGQYQVFDGTGFGGSDVVRFSIPAKCSSTGFLINSSGDVGFWGAPLTWGCTSSSCMDADNDCNTVDYKYIEYQRISGDQLVRRVLNNVAGQVREDVFANNITDFQISVSGAVASITLSSQKDTPSNRSMTAQANTSVFLRN